MLEPRTLRPLALSVALLAAVASVPGAFAEEAAWEALERSRRRLAEGPRTATFMQTFVPAGFSSGDTESGRLHLSLPRCLRWDYAEPFPRSYLLCDRTVWAWSPDDSVGDRYLSVSREEAGLDFLLLSVERLRERYEASVVEIGESHRIIRLNARRDDAAFTEAEIHLDAASELPRRLAYSDAGGDRTEFELEGFERLDETDLFLPPESMEWIDG